MAGAVERGAGIVDVDALERGREAVGIAFAPHLAVGDDVEAGALLRADRQEGRVVLRGFEEFRRDAPQLLRAHARREAARELFAVDQPVGLRIGTDQRGGQEPLHVSSRIFAHVSAGRAAFQALPGTACL